MNTARKEAYDFIVKNNLQKEVNEKFSKSYTNMTTEALTNYVIDKKREMEKPKKKEDSPIIKEAKKQKIEIIKEANEKNAKHEARKVVIADEKARNILRALCKSLHMNGLLANLD